jgi:hypothetical protein
MSEYQLIRVLAIRSVASQMDWRDQWFCYDRDGEDEEKRRMEFAGCTPMLIIGALHNGGGHDSNGPRLPRAE